MLKDGGRRPEPSKPSREQIARAVEEARLRPLETQAFSHPAVSSPATELVYSEDWTTQPSRSPQSTVLQQRVVARPSEVVPTGRFVPKRRLIAVIDEAISAANRRSIY